MSRRVFRCSVCGERKAREWSSLIGGPGLYIHCGGCNRKLRGPRYPLKMGGRQGFLVDMTKKEWKAYRDDLHLRWKNGESDGPYILDSAGST